MNIDKKELYIHQWLFFMIFQSAHFSIINQLGVGGMIGPSPHQQNNKILIFRYWKFILTTSLHLDNM